MMRNICICGCRFKKKKKRKKRWRENFLFSHFAFYAGEDKNKWQKIKK